MTAIYIANSIHSTDDFVDLSDLECDFLEFDDLLFEVDCINE